MPGLRLDDALANAHSSKVSGPALHVKLPLLFSASFNASFFLSFSRHLTLPAPSRRSRLWLFVDASAAGA